MSDCSRAFSVAIPSLSCDIPSYENPLTHKQTRDAFPFEAIKGRHRLFAVDVRGTLWKPDNRKDMADQVSCYREGKSVALPPSGKCERITQLCPHFILLKFLGFCLCRHAINITVVLHNCFIDFKSLLTYLTLVVSSMLPMYIN